MKLLTELDSLDNVKDGETRKLITKTTSSGTGNVVSDVSVSGDTITYTKGVNAVTDANYVHTDNNFTTTLKNKLDGIASGAEVNQNAFSNVKVGSTTIAADSKTDTLELVAGSNVTLTPDATNDKVTIAATDTTYESKAAASGGTAVSLVTTGEKYTWNNKQNALSTQTAYSEKGTATKVPQITTNTLGQVTKIEEVTITQPTVNNGTLTIQKNGINVQTFSANQSSNATANITVPTKTSDLTNDSGYVTTNTTYTLGTSGDNVTLTPSSGSAQSITVPFATKSYVGNLLNHAYNTSGNVPYYDRAYIDSINANRTAFYPGSCIMIERSTDGGATWTEVNTDTFNNNQRQDLFSMTRTSSIAMGTGTVTTNWQLRITLKYPTDNRYCSLDRVFIFMSTGGHSVTCTIDASRYGDKETYNPIVEDKPVSGWSGPNMISFGNTYSAWGSNSEWHKYNIRLIFKVTAVNANYSTNSPNFNDIRFYGPSYWGSVGTPRYAGHLYTWDYNQNVTFPANLKGNTLTSTGALTAGSISTTGNITASNGDVLLTKNATSGGQQIKWSLGSNDYARVYGAATAANAGYLEIATADDSNEPIYARQYSGNFATLTRTATLLDASGNTSFPGNITATGGFIGDLTGNATSATTATKATGDKNGNDITTTYYKASNPNGYTSNTGTITGVSVNGTSVATSGVANITSMPASILSGAIPSAVTATTQEQADNSTKLATTAFVKTAIDNLPEPMVFKGSLGTGGTITALPVDGSATIGDTYKVITAGTYASKTAKVGDTFICLTKTSSANTWELIPSGDEPGGTVTSITLKATSPIAIDSSSAITTSGTRTLSHANSGVTAGTYKSVTVNATGHVTAGSNPTTLSGYGITDAKIASGVITLGSNTITPLTASSTLDATKVSGTLPTSTYTNTKNTAGSTDISSKIFLIGATSQAANPQTYSDNEVYATSGVLTTKSVQVGGTAATIQYNSTDKCIEFIFA